MKYNYKVEEQTLEKYYQQAVQLIETQALDQIQKEIKESLDIFIERIETDKSLTQVIITTLLKKIIKPQQDIRLHMAKFPNGYSARVLDTKVTTPFFKRKFLKYANKETAFLTKATRAEIIWNFEEGIKLPLKSKILVEPFLKLIDKIENQTIDIEQCLVYILSQLYFLCQSHKVVFSETLKVANSVNIININRVVKMVEKHFEEPYSSRLPVIVIFAIYKQLFKTVRRFENKILLPLNVHTSADKHGYGDIEIRDNDNNPFEILEIKHNIPIDRNIILDIVKKSTDTKIQRYYILTTYKECFISKDDEEYINELILNIKRESGLEIIANGIVNTLKYYLRFVEDYSEFINTYTEELVRESLTSTEVRDSHIRTWQRILQE
ncbi:DNA methyltransferase [Cylindrospermopsis raciborskii]|uniref:DNA methyltransferase n=1 Tax=Cylindrospermopsis raciborskii CENA303 TaxID=1170769 RepID=A0A1X4G640_9CYAN|nr:DNA methyltransferase [Cylindrospermopsis raciborskii]MCZ2200397.1 DNA methyltransferase [Cylindrospermopsis raciborskii PAMP2012]MCZ2206747.1 DNA methyltransferase [Cylindrospermopsis raciborskii PAMP2011]OSO90031.1 DNA methyltransferase [Cylindrospermopsis raciborskii CENA303]